MRPKLGRRGVLPHWLTIVLAAPGRPKEAGREPDHPLRRQILETIRSRLGINEVGIQEKTGLKRSTVRHHLQALMDAGLLERHPVGRENHYFPAGTPARDVKRLSAATHGRAKRVLREVFLDPGLTQAELAERLGMTRKVLRSYLDFLGEHHLLQEQRDARTQRYWPGGSANATVYDRVMHNPHANLPRGPMEAARSRLPQRRDSRASLDRKG